ncbi:MAG: response regulator [bacterium]
MIRLKTVLLAEDNPRDAELTIEALAANNLANRVHYVRDGVEVMEYLNSTGVHNTRKSGNPAVVILDIKMPRMDGIEVLKAIRADPALKLLPVVMLTCSRNDQDLIHCYQHGANAYVVKPVKFADFVETVKHLAIFWGMINEIPPHNCIPA